MGTSPTVEAHRVSARIEGAQVLRDHIGAVLRHRGWPPESVARAVLACWEALVNAVEHGSAEGSELEVRLWASGEWASVWITDEGARGRAYPSGPAERPGDAQPRGRGRLLMAGLADSVDVQRVGTGTRVSLGFANHAASRAQRAA